MTHDPSVKTGNEVTESVTLGASQTPPHDPLCHLCRETGEFNLMEDRCYYCKLIARVRADERSRIIGVMERNADGDAMKVIDAVLDML